MTNASLDTEQDTQVPDRNTAGMEDDENTLSDNGENPKEPDNTPDNTGTAEVDTKPEEEMIPATAQNENMLPKYADDFPDGEVVFDTLFKDVDTYWMFTKPSNKPYRISGVLSIDSDKKPHVKGYIQYPFDNEETVETAIEFECEIPYHSKTASKLTDNDVIYAQEAKNAIQKFCKKIGEELGLPTPPGSKKRKPSENKKDTVAKSDTVESRLYSGKFFNISVQELSSVHEHSKDNEIDEVYRLYRFVPTENVENGYQFLLVAKRAKGFRLDDSGVDNAIWYLTTDTEEEIHQPIRDVQNLDSHVSNYADTLTLGDGATRYSINGVSIPPIMDDSNEHTPRPRGEDSGGDDREEKHETIDVSSDEHYGRWEFYRHAPKVRPSGLSGKYISDMSNAVISYASGKQIYDAYYLKNMDTGIIKPFGPKEAKLAMGSIPRQRNINVSDEDIYREPMKQDGMKSSFEGSASLEDAMDEFFETRAKASISLSSRIQTPTTYTVYQNADRWYIMDDDGNTSAQKVLASAGWKVAKQGIKFSYGLEDVKLGSPIKAPSATGLLYEINGETNDGRKFIITSMMMSKFAIISVESDEQNGSNSFSVGYKTTYHETDYALPTEAEGGKNIIIMPTVVQHCVRLLLSEYQKESGKEVLPDLKKETVSGTEVKQSSNTHTPYEVTTKYSKNNSDSHVLMMTKYPGGKTKTPLEIVKNADSGEYNIYYTGGKILIRGFTNQQNAKAAATEILMNSTYDEYSDTFSSSSRWGDYMLPQRIFRKAAAGTFEESLFNELVKQKRAKVDKSGKVSFKRGGKWIPVDSKEAAYQAIKDDDWISQAVKKNIIPVYTDVESSDEYLSSIHDIALREWTKNRKFFLERNFSIKWPRASVSKLVTNRAGDMEPVQCGMQDKTITDMSKTMVVLKDFYNNVRLAVNSNQENPHPFIKLISAKYNIRYDYLSDSFIVDWNGKTYKLNDDGVFVEHSGDVLSAVEIENDKFSIQTTDSGILVKSQPQKGEEHPSSTKFETLEKAIDYLKSEMEKYPLESDQAEPTNGDENVNDTTKVDNNDQEMNTGAEPGKPVFSDPEAEERYKNVIGSHQSAIYAEPLPGSIFGGEYTPIPRKVAGIAALTDPQNVEKTIFLKDGDYSFSGKITRIASVAGMGLVVDNQRVMKNLKNIDYAVFSGDHKFVFTNSESMFKEYNENYLRRSVVENIKNIFGKLTEKNGIYLSSMTMPYQNQIELHFDGQNGKITKENNPIIEFNRKGEITKTHTRTVGKELNLYQPVEETIKLLTPVFLAFLDACGIDSSEFSQAGAFSTNAVLRPKGEFELKTVSPDGFSMETTITKDGIRVTVYANNGESKDNKIFQFKIDDGEIIDPMWHGQRNYTEKTESDLQKLLPSFLSHINEEIKKLGDLNISSSTQIKAGVQEASAKLESIPYDVSQSSISSASGKNSAYGSYKVNTCTVSLTPKNNSQMKPFDLKLREVKPETRARFVEVYSGNLKLSLTYGDINVAVKDIRKFADELKYDTDTESVFTVRRSGECVVLFSSKNLFNPRAVAENNNIPNDLPKQTGSVVSSQQIKDIVDEKIDKDGMFRFLRGAYSGYFDGNPIVQCKLVVSNQYLRNKENLQTRVLVAIGDEYDFDIVDGVLTGILTEDQTDNTLSVIGINNQNYKTGTIEYVKFAGMDKHGVVVTNNKIFHDVFSRIAIQSDEINSLYSIHLDYNDNGKVATNFSKTRLSIEGRELRITYDANNGSGNITQKGNYGADIILVSFDSNGKVTNVADDKIHSLAGGDQGVDKIKDRLARMLSVFWSKYQLDRNDAGGDGEEGNNDDQDEGTSIDSPLDGSQTSNNELDSEVSPEEDHGSEPNEPESNTETQPNVNQHDDNTHDQVLAGLSIENILKNHYDDLTDYRITESQLYPIKEKKISSKDKSILRVEYNTTANIKNPSFVLTATLKEDNVYVAEFPNGGKTTYSVYNNKINSSTFGVNITQKKIGYDISTDSWYIPVYGTILNLSEQGTLMKHTPKPYLDIEVGICKIFPNGDGYEVSYYEPTNTDENGLGKLTPVSHLTTNVFNALDFTRKFMQDIFAKFEEVSGGSKFDASEKGTDVVLGPYDKLFYLIPDMKDSVYQWVLSLFEAYDHDVEYLKTLRRNTVANDKDDGEAKKAKKQLIVDALQGIKNQNGRFNNTVTADGKIESWFDFSSNGVSNGAAVQKGDVLHLKYDTTDGDKTIITYATVTNGVFEVTAKKVISPLELEMLRDDYVENHAPTVSRYITPDNDFVKDDGHEISELDTLDVIYTPEKIIDAPEGWLVSMYTGKSTGLDVHSGSMQETGTFFGDQRTMVFAFSAHDANANRYISNTVKNKYTMIMQNISIEQVQDAVLSLDIGYTRDHLRKKNYSQLVYLLGDQKFGNARKFFPTVVDMNPSGDKNIVENTVAIELVELETHPRYDVSVYKVVYTPRRDDLPPLELHLLNKITHGSEPGKQTTYVNMYNQNGDYVAHCGRIEDALESCHGISEKLQINQNGVYFFTDGFKKPILLSFDGTPSEYDFEVEMTISHTHRDNKKDAKSSQNGDTKQFLRYKVSKSNPERHYVSNFYLHPIEKRGSADVAFVTYTYTPLDGSDGGFQFNIDMKLVTPSDNSVDRYICISRHESNIPLALMPYDEDAARRKLSRLSIKLQLTADGDTIYAMDKNNKPIILATKSTESIEELIKGIVGNGGEDSDGN